jgi:hypothetical protein
VCALEKKEATAALAGEVCSTAAARQGAEAPELTRKSSPRCCCRCCLRVYTEHIQPHCTASPHLTLPLAALSTFNSNFPIHSRGIIILSHKIPFYCTHSQGKKYRKLFLMPCLLLLSLPFLALLGKYFVRFCELLVPSLSLSRILFSVRAMMMMKKARLCFHFCSHFYCFTSTP